MVRRLEFPNGNKHDKEAIIKFVLGGWKDVPEMRKSDLRLSRSIW